MFARLTSFLFGGCAPIDADDHRPFAASTHVSCSVASLSFGTALPADGAAFEQSFELINESRAERAFVVSLGGSVPSEHVAVCDFEPRRGLLPSHGVPVRVSVTVRLRCTTRLRVWLDVSVDDGLARCRVPVEAASVPSARLDPECVELLDRERPLGAGGFGTVFRGSYRGETVAVKLINEQNALHMSDEQVRRFTHEVAMLERAGAHACIARFVGASHVPGRFMIVTELVPLGCVGDLLATAPYALGVRFALDLARALVHLHALPIVFRDVKSDNLLAVSLAVGAPVNCKLIDFGIARSVKSAHKPRRYTTRIGSIPYMAPELIDDQPYAAPVDIYAAGIVMAELAMRQRAWHDANVWQLPGQVMHGARPALPPATPLAFAQLARACWDADAAARPTAVELEKALRAL